MFKIVIIRGGLGNQMFAYAFYLSVKHSLKFSYIIIEPVHCFHAHNGFELPDVFVEVEPKKSYEFYRRVQKIHAEYFTKKLFSKAIEQNLRDPFSDFERNNFAFIVYDGFWQTDKYFQHIRSQILRTFEFDEKRLNDKTKLLSGIIQNENSVSIHVRRGDYINHDELGGICTLAYYINSIKYIEEHTKDPIYYLFTDDKFWVSENFNFLHYKLIEWNNSIESWQDMYLMTKCKHNIIANSSFSWWGAWLNSNKGKIVIAPSKWFITISANYIVPETWIKVGND